MNVRLAYGRTGLDVELPDDALVVEPSDPPPCIDQVADFRAAVRTPFGAAPLRELIGSHERVVIVTSDVTRATPHRWLKSSGMVRDTPTDSRPAFVVDDGNYVSARWPGDTHTFATVLSQKLKALK